MVNKIASELLFATVALVAIFAVLVTFSTVNVYATYTGGGSGEGGGGGSATLSVITTVSNSYGGTDTAGNFLIHVTYTNGTDVSGSPGIGSSAGTVYTLAPGTYSVNVNQVQGYSASIGGSCASSGAVTLANSTSNTCTITITDQPAQINVIEDVVGGPLSANAFTINVAGNSPSSSTFTGSATGTSVTIDQGNYSVTENQIVLFNTTKSKGCGEGWWDNFNRWWWNGGKGNGNNDNWALNWTKWGWNNTRGAFDPKLPAGSWSGTKNNYNKQNIYGYYAVSYSSGCAGTIYVGQSVTCTITSTFTVPQRLSVELTPNTTHVELGGSIGFTANIVGGAAPYSYVIEVQNTTSRGRFVPTGQNGTSTSGNLTFSETPPKLGADFYEIVVTDSLGLTASDSVHVLVSAEDNGGGWGWGGH
jgi:hypothetical protein